MVAVDAMEPAALLEQVDLPNYISDVHDLLRAAIGGESLPKRELEKVAQTIINRAIQDWGNHAAYSLVAARILAYMSEREETKAREIRKTWGEPEPPFAMRSVMSYMQEILGEKEEFKKMDRGWDKWFSFLSCLLHFYQFSAMSPVLSTSIPTMLSGQVWLAMRELTEWNKKKTNVERIRHQMSLIQTFMLNAGSVLCADTKNMEEFTNILRDKFGDPNLTDEKTLDMLMEILELRASWRKTGKQL